MAEESKNQTVFIDSKIERDDEKHKVNYIGQAIKNVSVAIKAGSTKFKKKISKGHRRI